VSVPTTSQAVARIAKQWLSNQNQKRIYVALCIPRIQRRKLKLLLIRQIFRSYRLTIRLQNRL